MAEPLSNRLTWRRQHSHPKAKTREVVLNLVRPEILIWHSSLPVPA